MSCCNKILLLLAVLLLGQSAVAKEVVKMTFVTDPPGATVYDLKGNSCALTGKLQDVEIPEGPVVEFFLRLEGYEDLPLTVKRAKFLQSVREHGVYPDPSDVKIQLQPKNGRKQSMPQNPAILVGAALLAVLAVGLGLRLRKRLIRAELLEQLKAASLDAEGSLIMTVLGGYRLIEMLGRGGMATVYRAIRDESLDRQETYACKVIQREHGQEEEFRQRFRRECKVCHELTHPAIVRVFDWGETEDGRLYLIMEEVKGKTVRDAIAGGLSVASAMRLLDPIFEAVHYAHGKGVVHRDLKPENIMLDERGQVKIMDFGLARKVDSQSHLTKTGTALGTPAYMAPEQIQGGQSDPAMDQYALGILAYEMLVGRLPFVVEDLVQMLFAHLSETPPSPRELRPSLPAALNPVLLRMLKKKPEERFPSVEAALEAMRSALGARSL